MYNNRPISKEKWIKRFESIHGKNFYDYSRLPDVFYQNKSIEVYCYIHNLIFKTTPIRHYNNQQSCPKCRYDKMSYSRKHKIISRQKFVIQARQIHRDAYEYSELPLEFSLYDSIIIFCNKCDNIFFCTGENHLKGKGCSCS